MSVYEDPIDKVEREFARQLTRQAANLYKIEVLRGRDLPDRVYFAQYLRSALKYLEKKPISKDEFYSRMKLFKVTTLCPIEHQIEIENKSYNYKRNGYDYSYSTKKVTIPKGFVFGVPTVLYLGRYWAHWMLMPNPHNQSFQEDSYDEERDYDSYRFFYGGVNGPESFCATDGGRDIFAAGAYAIVHRVLSGVVQHYAEGTVTVPKDSWSTGKQYAIKKLTPKT